MHNKSIQVPIIKKVTFEIEILLRTDGVIPSQYSPVEPDLHVSCRFEMKPPWHYPALDRGHGEHRSVPRYSGV
jgi:hypothetical protein